ncbi:MAG: 50S ribosomal protein L15 [Candidatus Omnitrophica bacterium]|nr:50S ribosomal protein L15 [Candidatus Omnitrophota bacterium]MCM8794006.1 50S ribosomal protein L15 [Candidatus Omnitrophota bacterium]
MKIHTLRPKIKRKTKKRLGRGTGSGHGKTSGRGQKGQKARTGFELRPGFEGGQMPLIRRIPKRGFVNKFAKEFQIVNLGMLDRKFAKEEKVTPEILKERGLISKLSLPVKILGEGELSKPLTICAHKFSKQAIEKIKKAQASFELIGA